MKKKIAFVVHRYGLEVNGGAEMYCRVMAERLKDFYEVEVLTTCALDYVTWEDYYDSGMSEINGVTIRRFKVDHSRNTEQFNEIYGRMINSPNASDKKQEEWLDAQGPTSSQLIEYIKENESEYDTFLFVTYLYYHTVKGLREVGSKSILIPTAHDEPPVYFKVYREVFNSPKAIIYLTEEEKEFVHKQFKNQYIPSEVIGMGIDVPNQYDVEKFKNKHNLDKYLIYVGRIDESKGCKEMFDFFIRYKREVQNDVKLILMGKAAMPIPSHPDIISLGFVSEEDKFNGIKGAQLLILPSKYESFSIAMLEALAESIPAVVNGKCEVLKGHCIRSNGALYYRDYNEFKEVIKLIIEENRLRIKLGENAKRYVKENYGWNKIIYKFTDIIDRTMGNKLD